MVVGRAKYASRVCSVCVAAAAPPLPWWEDGIRTLAVRIPAATDVTRTRGGAVPWRQRLRAWVVTEALRG
jgi:hypothetical protein